MGTDNLFPLESGEIASTKDDRRTLFVRDFAVACVAVHLPLNKWRSRAVPSYPRRGQQWISLRTNPTAPLSVLCRSLGEQVTQSGPSPGSLHSIGIAPTL